MALLSSFGNRIKSGYLLSFLLLLISFFLIFYVQQRMGRVATWVAYSYTVVTHVESLKAAFTDAETGVRGYLLTKDDRFLRPYTDARTAIPPLFDKLRNLVTGSNTQRGRLDTLQYLTQKRMDSITRALEVFRTNNFTLTTNQQRREASLVTMDSMRLYAERIRQGELQAMHHRQARLTALFRGSRTVAIISLGIVFAALLYSFITFHHENKARQKADKDLENNMSELKEKNTELKELKDMEKFTSTGRIARTIAHEVRNPLTNILLATEQLQEIEGKNAESQELLKLINRNAARINQLVSELLDATRFVNLRFESVLLNDLLEETLEMAKDRIDLNRVIVEKTYLAENCCVSVDREKIKVAFLNIIVNAIEAMDGSTGFLQVKTKQQGDKCVIEIRDNGKGMDEEVLQKLFEPYFTDKPKGNGLGLTNTQNIILNHNGKISVHSKPGSGSFFLITLDVAKV